MQRFRWQIEVIGHDFDIDALSAIAPALVMSKDDGRRYVSHPDWEQLNDAGAVRSAATTLTGRLSSTLALTRGNSPVEVGHLTREFGADGPRAVHHLDAVSISSRSSVGTPSLGGGAPSVDSARPYEVRLDELRQRSIKVNQTVELIVDSRWTELYKAYEALRRELGGQNGIAANQIATVSEIKSFTRSAQPHRHYEQHYPNPIPHDAAVSLLKRLLRALVDRKNP